MNSEWNHLPKKQWNPIYYFYDFHLFLENYNKFPGCPFFLVVLFNPYILLININRV